MNKLNEVRKSDAHKQAQTAADIIDKREHIRLGNLTYIQIAEVTERKVEIHIPLSQILLFVSRIVTSKLDRVAALGTLSIHLTCPRKLSPENINTFSRTFTRDD